MTAPASAEHQKGAAMAEMAKDTPLGPFRERLGETYRRVEITEVIKLIDNLPLRRAPGADAISAEIYKKTRALIPYIREVCDSALKTGHFPNALRRVHLIPLLKIGKNPQSQESRRPISLLCTMVKIMENILYH